MAEYTTSTDSGELDSSPDGREHPIPKKNPSTDPNVRKSPKPLAHGLQVEPVPVPESAWEGATHYIQYSHVIGEVDDTADKSSVPLRDSDHHQYQPVEYISGTGEVQVKLVEANLGAYWDLSLIQLEPEGDEVGYYYIESIHLFPVQGVDNVSFYSPEDALLAEESKLDSSGALKEDVPPPSVGVGKKAIKIKDAEINTPYEENSHYNIVMD